MEKYCLAGQVTDDMEHENCMLDTQSYKHTLTIRNIYSFTLQQWCHEHAPMLDFV
jgi:hypothetical protein